MFFAAVLAVMTSVQAQSNTTAPTVSIQSVDSMASEAGSNPGVFSVFRSGDTTTNLTVFYTISGAASNGVDYVTLSPSVVILAGEANALITVQPLDDYIVESTENVTLTLKTNVAYRIVSPSVATVNIFDNETNHPPTVTMITPGNGDNFADPASILISAEGTDIDGASPTVSFYCNGALMSGTPKKTNNVFSLLWTNIPAGQFSITAKARDAINEGISVTSAPANVTVTRTNPAPYVYIYIPSNGSRFTNIMTMGLSAYAFPGATDRHVTNVDLILGSNVIASIPPSSSTANYFHYQWTNPPPGEYVLTARATDDIGLTTLSSAVTFTVVNGAKVSLTVVDATAEESSGEPNTGAAVISRTGDTSNAVTVYYKIVGSASNGVDYVTLPGSVTLPPGASEATVVVTPIDDSQHENIETVSLTLLTNSAYTTIYPTNGTISIIDNDTNQSPVVALSSPTNNTVYSGPTNITLNATASDPDGWIIQVSFYNGTNQIGLMSASNSALYSFTWTNVPPGTYSLTARAYDNFKGERSSEPVSITVVGQTNTPPATVTVTATDAIASEVRSNSTVAPNPGVFRITRNGGNTNGSLTVSFTMTGTATYGIDYAQTVTSLLFQAGQLSRELVIYPVDDNLVEGAETVVMTLNTNTAYVIGDPHSATMSIEDNDTIVSNVPPTVSITTPTNNATFIAPANITIYANATDSAGTGTNAHWIDTVEFFEGTNSLGIVTNCPECAYIQNPFHVYWTNVPAGTYTLRAKATDNEGASTISEPITVFVNPAEVQRTVVTVTAVDAEASEGPTSNTTLNTATFKIRRTGDTNIALTVYYNVGGTATPGVDYNQIPTSITIRAGMMETNLVIRPIDDTLREDTETVAIAIEAPICADIYPPPPGCYDIGTPGSAVANIYDNDFNTNTPPTVQILTPTNGAVFFSPANIEITAQASDTDGQVTRVDFFRGDFQIGSDTTAPYSMVWSNVQAGSYNISARATDNAGAIRWSGPVSVSVKLPTELSFVKRTLPLWYVPGVKVVVQLRAEPKTNTTSYAVEDLAPTNWVVGTIGAGGTVDPADGKIKFGPFNDAQPRTLIYEVTPPAGTVGEKHFVGSGIANSIISPVLGAVVINPAPPHPADKNPTNFVMTLSEVTAYSTAWRRCERWLISPNPVPVSYVSRAGYLYVKGSDYRISTAYPTPFPPMLWVSTNETTVSPTLNSTNEVPWSANYPGLGTAVSAMPTNYNVGVPFTVSIAVTPNSGVSAYAVEERVPYGWVVTNVSSDGVFCPATMKVRWGAFLDNTARTLSYTITPAATNAPSVVEFAGVASFDGINGPITGQRRTTRTTTLQPAQLQSVKTLDDGNRLLTFIGQAGIAYTLEASSNFGDWQPIEELLNNDGVLQYIDLATNNVIRFYRAVPQQ